MSRKGTFVGNRRATPPSVTPVYAPPLDMFIAATKNEFYWPVYWRVVIHKIELMHGPTTGRHPVRVTPKNPAYAEYLSKDTWMSTDREEGRIPDMYLDRVEFETIEEMDKWAMLCARIDS